MLLIVSKMSVWGASQYQKCRQSTYSDLVAKLVIVSMSQMDYQKKCYQANPLLLSLTHSGLCRTDCSFASSMFKFKRKKKEKMSVFTNKWKSDSLKTQFHAFTLSTFCFLY